MEVSKELLLFWFCIDSIMHRELYIPRRFVLTCLHTCWVLLVTVLIWRTYEGPGYQEELQLWALVFFIDLPAGGLLYLIEMAVADWLYTSTSSQFSQVIFPAVGFLVLGGMQWWAIGWVIDRRKSQTSP